MRHLPAIAILLAAAAWAGEGSDLELGHFGDGNGKLSGVNALAFDSHSHLYVLDTVPGQGNRPAGGNGLVQEFDGAGKFVAQFSIAPDAPAPNTAARLAVDARRQVWVTQPRAGAVYVYAPGGQTHKVLAVPNAFAVATSGERVYVAAGGDRTGAKEIAVFDLDGAPQPPIALAQPLTEVVSMAVDPRGFLWLLAAKNQLYQFALDGRLLTTLGSGLTTRVQDGSELLHAVACDSRGDVFTMTWGNPGMVVRFDADLKHVSTREGQFKWADPWSTHSAYTPLAVDPSDRLWVGVPGHVEDGNKAYHFKPCVLRVESGFFDPAKSGVTVASTLALGLQPRLETGLAYDVTDAAQPLDINLVITPARRRVDRLRVDWHAQDTFGAVVDHGAFDLPLTDGQEARQAFTFHPPRYGWYTLVAALSGGGEALMTFGHHLGVTPHYPNLPWLAAGESPGGTSDCPRSAWCGLRLVRVNTGLKPAELDREIAAADKYGCLLLVQFESKERCTPDAVQAVVTRCKGRVKYWEVVNEPNFTMNPASYVTLLKQVSATIHQIDPEARVLGPDVCGVDLGWYEQFYKLGGKDAVDILSVHDYEGHESIDPNHWLWKFGELRKIMARYGDEAKPIWQTERAIGGIRGDNFLGSAQAVRITLHRDLLDRLGIPSEHNAHYYLNDHGYSQVPTFIWSAAGPHPAALALRTRAAMIGDRRFAGTLDFGATGNKLFWGQRYDGADGSTVILRNLGMSDTPVTLVLAAPAEAFDAFGNALSLPTNEGHVTLTLGQLPTYLRLANGGNVTPQPVDLGENLARGATFSYSAGTKGAFDLLNNGLFETIHAGNPMGGTDGKKIWTGLPPSLPQTLQIDLGAPKPVSDVILYGVRADNAFCALLDYDLEWQDGETWRPLAVVRAGFPASERVRTPLCVANTWLLDDNLHWNHFAPVTARRLRVVVRRTTYGFLPDDSLRAWGNKIPALLQLKEVEVYGPRG